MKKLFATALMAMSMGSVFAQDNIVANDTVKTDTTKNCPAKGCQKSLAALISNDTVTTDSTKAKLTAMLACVAMNDTVTTDSTKSAPAALVALNDTVTTDSAKAQPAALVAANDTVVTDSTKAQPAKPTALVAMIEEKSRRESNPSIKRHEKNHRLTTLIFLILKEENVPAFSSYFSCSPICFSVRYFQ